MQRATLAEKEVTTLKEQIATNSSTPCSETKDSTNMDRHSYESEISAKEKEVSLTFSVAFIICRLLKFVSPSYVKSLNKKQTKQNNHFEEPLKIFLYILKLT